MSTGLCLSQIQSSQSHEETCSSDGDFRVWRDIPHPCGGPKTSAGTLLAAEEGKAVMEQTWGKRTSQCISVPASDPQTREILHHLHSKSAQNPSGKGLKPKNVSKIHVMTEGLCATVEKSVGVPKWGENIDIVKPQKLQFPLGHHGLCPLPLCGECCCLLT